MTNIDEITKKLEKIQKEEHLLQRSLDLKRFFNTHDNIAKMLYKWYTEDIAEDENKHIDYSQLSPVDKDLFQKRATRILEKCSEAL